MTLLDFLKKKHQQKVKEKERFEVLNSFKNRRQSQWENPFVRLEELSHHTKETAKENKFFKKLDRSSAKIKKSQRLITQRKATTFLASQSASSHALMTFNNIKNIKRWNEKTIIQKLREISKRK